MKKVVGLLLPILLFALDPIARIDLKGSSIDLIIQSDLIITGGDAGVIEIFKNRKPYKSFKLNDVENAFGKAPPKIYSLDLINNQLLVVSEGNALEGRALAIYTLDGKLIRTLIDAKERDLIRKARFVGDDKIFLMEVGGVARLIDTNGTQIYNKEILGSSFSDFALSADKTKVAITSEAGDVKIVSVKSGNVEQSLQGGNRDNVYDISWSKNLIATSGQDRIVSIFSKDGSTQHIEAPFLVSAVAISPDAETIAYVKDEAGSIAVVGIKNKEEKAVLNGHFAMISNIIFTSNNDLITSGDDRYVLIWRIK